MQKLTAPEPPLLSGGGLRNMRLYRKDPMVLYREMEALGAPLVRFKLLHKTVYYMVTLPGVIRLIGDGDSFIKEGPAFKSLKQVIGDGILISQGEVWQKRRMLLGPAFHAEALPHYEGMIIRHGQALMQKLATHAQKGQPFDLLPLLENHSFAVMRDTIFGNIAEKVGSDAALSKALRTKFTAAHHVVARGFAWPPWFPFGEARRLRRANRAIAKAIEKLTERKLLGGEPDKCLMTTMLYTMSSEGHPLLSRQEMANEVGNWLIAGLGPNGLVLGWTLNQLARHGEVMDKLLLEFKGVLGERELPTLADLRQMPYARTVVLETIRMFPPIYATARACEKPVEVEGMLVPPNSLVIGNMYRHHMNPAYWPEPEVFNPSRFEGLAEGEWPKAFLGFGTGARDCLAWPMAMMHVMLLLPMLLRKFSWQIPQGFEAGLHYDVNLRPKNGFLMVLEGHGAQGSEGKH